jgi:hypothetical protein
MPARSGSGSTAIRIDTATHEALAAQAKAEDRTISATLRRAVGFYISHANGEALIEPKTRASTRRKKV